VMLVSGRLLSIPLVKLSVGSRSFSVSGPIVWNALPDYLRNPTLSSDVFKRYTKLFCLFSINTMLECIINCFVPPHYIS